MPEMTMGIGKHFLLVIIGLWLLFGVYSNVWFWFSQEEIILKIMGLVLQCNLMRISKMRLNRV